MASVIRARGGRSPHRDLACLPASELRRFRKIVYLVIDGLGEAQLRNHLARGGRSRFFAVWPHDIITSVFPATTAAAVTTFVTGAAPAEHGIVGWHLNLPDLGMVSTILPAVTRTGVPLARAEFDLKRFLDLPGHLASAKGRRWLLSWGHIPASRYSKAGPRWSRRVAYRTLGGLERCIGEFVKSRGGGLAYAYWPDYDSICHERGCTHEAAHRHLRALDRMLERLARAVRRAGDCVLLVTADHGMMDSLPERRVDLSVVPGLMGCLATLPAGDARQVQCFVRPAAVARFQGIVRRYLRPAAVCVAGADLIRSGILGPGRPHCALAGRIGDFVLLAREGYAFGTTLPLAKPDFNVANHGGLSQAEMRVPLYVISPAISQSSPGRSSAGSRRVSA